MDWSRRACFKLRFVSRRNCRWSTKETCLSVSFLALMLFVSGLLSELFTFGRSYGWQIQCGCGRSSTVFVRQFCKGSQSKQNYSKAIVRQIHAKSSTMRVKWDSNRASLRSRALKTTAEQPWPISSGKSTGTGQRGGVIHTPAMRKAPDLNPGYDVWYTSMVSSNSSKIRIRCFPSVGLPGGSDVRVFGAEFKG